MKLEDAVTIEDLRRLARRRLPSFIFENMEDGNGDGRVPAQNTEALDRWRLVPRVLADCSRITQQVSLFGKTYAGPFGISATGMGPLFRRGSEIMLAETAAALNIPYMLSTVSGASIEEVARVASGNAWFQLYGATDRDITEHMIGRARDAGVDVLAMTVDCPIIFRSERGLRSGVPYPPKLTARLLPYYVWEAIRHPGWTLDYLQHGVPMLGNYAPYARKGAGALEVLAFWAKQMISNQTWDDVALVRRQWPGKLVIKGVLSPQDARRAVDLGADAVTVSNHGGRVFDRSIAAIDALPAVKRAVGARVPVLFDSGIRRGSHVAVARCLGADFSFVGRATLYGVIAGGAAGARRAVDLIRAQIAENLIVVGCPDFNDLGPHFLADPPAAS